MNLHLFGQLRWLDLCHLPVTVAVLDVLHLPDLRWLRLAVNSPHFTPDHVTRLVLSCPDHVTRLVLSCPSLTELIFCTAYSLILSVVDRQLPRERAVTLRVNEWILQGILGEFLQGILEEILQGILLEEILQGVLEEILQGILEEILQSILEEILQGILEERPALTMDRDCFVCFFLNVWVCCLAYLCFHIYRLSDANIVVIRAELELCDGCYEDDDVTIIIT